MKKYLAELHKKPDDHKKRFAFLASSTMTLIIFGVWSLATFGLNGGMMVTQRSALGTSAVTESEVGPFQSLRRNVATSLEALRSAFGELKTRLETLNFETEYKDMKDDALKVYGQ